MCWKNLFNRFILTYQRLAKRNINNIQNEYVKELATNLDYSFQKLNQTNDKLDQLSERRATKFQILDDKLFLNVNSYSGSVLMVVRQSTKEIINVNEKFYQVLGYSTQDIIGLLHSNVNFWVNNQDPNTIEDLLQESPIIKQQIFQLRTKSGEIKDFIFSAEELDIDGQVLIFYMASDITSITKKSTFMSYRCLNDPEYTMKYISYDCENLTGYKVDEIVDNKLIPFGKIINEEDYNYVWEIIQKALEEQKAYEMQYRIKKKNGNIKWVWERGQGIFYNNGNFLALEGLIEDISELKKSEDKLFQIRDDLREQIQLTIKELLQDNNSRLRLVQEIPVLMDALNVENIADIAALTQLLMPEKIADNIDTELHLKIIALSKVALTLQLYQAITEPTKQDKTLLTAKKELKAIKLEVNDLPVSLQVFMNQIIIRWQSILNDEKTSSKDVSEIEAEQ